MKIYLKKTVYEAALERVRWVFENFDDVVVSCSGGKDSDVVLRLSLIVAEEMGRLPLKVAWLDQEIEWQMVADHVKEIMYDPRVEPMWFQMPFVISNATSAETPYLDCWDAEKQNEWIRERDPISIKENITGEVRFAEMFKAIAKAYFPNRRMAYIAGVRCEESPTRYTALTSAETYKGVTWGKVLDRRRDHYTFYPVYDWSYTDVWKALHDNEWPYCRIYDFYYQYGIPVREMRVSNLNHETAVRSLFIAHEVEPETWGRISRRLAGTNTAKVLGDEMIKVGKEPPYMFEDWKEYRDYLIPRLFADPEKQATFTKRFAKMDEQYAAMAHIEDMHRIHVKALLANDHEFVLTSNWERSPPINNLRKFWMGITHPNNATNKYIPKEALHESH